MDKPKISVLYHSFVMDKPKIRDLYHSFVMDKPKVRDLYHSKRWSHLWSNKHIKIHSDSTSAVSIIKEGPTKNSAVMGYLRELFWLSALYRVSQKNVNKL